MSQSTQNALKRIEMQKKKKKNEKKGSEGISMPSFMPTDQSITVDTRGIHTDTHTNKQTYSPFII